MTTIHEALSLYVSDERLTFEPLYADATQLGETLVINRRTGAVQYNVPVSPTMRQEEVVTVYGILGTIRLFAGDYLCLVTSRERVGKISGCDVYRVTDVDVRPIPRLSTNGVTSEQLKDDEEYLAMVRYILNCRFLYYSYTLDLTHSLQRANGIDRSRPMWERADERFFWNRHLQSRLIEATYSSGPGLGRFILPVVCGFVEVRALQANGVALSLALVTRRSVFRAGTRYHSRGIDDQGHVANHVETEQIVELPATRHVYSYVQTRGSVPFFWRQVANARYTPLLVLDRRPDTLAVMATHFGDQEARYGDQIVLNLLNTRGYEKPLVDEFGRLVNELQDPRITYVHFDFHHECKGMRFDRVSRLLDQIAAPLARQRWFHADGAGAVVARQTSVCRTNCLDCLDRTNVVQSMLARHALEAQLGEAGVLRAGERIAAHPEFDSVFKNVWADNADAVSIMYSGTGALKTDFTRTGRRSRSGAVQDLINSLTRYVKNNYFDGHRQDAFDLFLGVFQVVPTTPRLAARRTQALKFYVLPLVLLISTLSLLYNLVFMAYPLSYALVRLAVSLALVYATAQLILLFGTEFVDRPRLRAHGAISFSSTKPPVVLADPAGSLAQYKRATDTVPLRAAALGDATLPKEAGIKLA